MSNKCLGGRKYLMIIFKDTLRSFIFYEVIIKKFFFLNKCNCFPRPLKKTIIFFCLPLIPKV